MGNENSNPRSGGATDPKERGKPSHVPKKSGGSTPVPPSSNRGGGQPSDGSTPISPSFTRGGGQPRDGSTPVSPSFSRERGEPSHVHKKSGGSTPVPPSSNRGGGQPSDGSTSISPSFSRGGGQPRDGSTPVPPSFSRGGGQPSDGSTPVSLSFSRGGEQPSDGSTSVPPSSNRGGGQPRDGSTPVPPSFGRGGGQPSDRSTPVPPSFSRGGGIPRDGSTPVPPSFSRGCGQPSDESTCVPPSFSRGGGEPSSESIKSGGSTPVSSSFSRGREGFSYVSMKCDGSMDNLPHYNSGAVPSGPRHSMVERTGHLQQDSHLAVDDVLERHKTSMKNKCKNLVERTKTEVNKTLLNRIYTQCYIMEGESEGVNEEHEVLQMEKTSRRHLEDSPINCLDIFKALHDLKGETEEKKILADVAKSFRPKKIDKERNEDKELKVPKLRSVLTKGFAGIGKTVSVQKFILAWADGKSNQDVDFMFVLPFRELNLVKDDQYSLHKLLCDFHPEIKDLDPRIYNQTKAVFIFDGLDESRIPLNFKQCEKVTNITTTSSVDVLIINLIKGELLPSALIWITSRPAAAKQIPPKYINRVTEIQGFNDPQKEEYFKKRISDEDQAQRIISHIKTVRSLHIMCHIPVFCWISATVLQQIMKQHNTEIPKTLTEMYSHFLLTQTNIKNEKYEKDERDPKNLLESNRTILLKLAELAFKQLMKGNVMFYEEDLRESSIDVTEASVYSGIFTEIFREECVLYQRKVYCFVHLSFQEFLAAVYVFHCYENKKMKVLHIFTSLNREWSENVPLDEILKRAVDKAVESQNGHLDLLLRFLLGISLESNQRLLQGLLTPTQSSSEKTTEYIKSLIKGDYHISSERSMNLFLCLSEMNDQSLSRELQEYLKSERHSEEKLSPGQCSALACMLLISEEVLDELDLRKYNTSEEGYKRLIPALTVCRKAVLSGCNLTKNSCEAFSSAVQSANSSLNDLDLSNNDLQDSGVELLFAGLKSSSSKLKILRLALCKLGEKACENLALTLQSTDSSLKELDLSNNDVQDSGVELLSAGLKSSSCKLEILRLSGCMVTNKGCSSLASAMKSNPSHLRELDLTYNHPGESGVKLLSNLLKDPHCALEKLQVDHGGKIRMKPGLRKYAVDLTLDRNTMNSNLYLSERNRKVNCLDKKQSYPDHPDRFDRCAQVLSVESLTGRCYWEVQWSGWDADISVSYRGIKRKGLSADCVFGNNHQSWSLNCYNNRYSVRNNKQKTDLPAPPSPSNRVGVYLDWGSGTLSFYTVSPNTHTLTHLHTLTTTFTEQLYAGFRVYADSSVQLCVIE
ncbi:NACHT, LRR and PYD domains-containing protein 12-like isoform X2 [Colossoma macropomum]|uniref:NACHT, LRR and PYD domains-containing protein 12-like isoform X2 n=1 Tax=Colossoma macropomum TaxID=42526 RepID=UPI0018641516|nr:NACHT, LRR and PYD domains-containing protein 12-like isoform X2 [Colossoma macropomum]